MALHGSLRGFNQILEGGGPEEAAEALNDYFAAAAAVVRACAAGSLTAYAGASFGATWELGELGSLRRAKAKAGLRP